MRTTSTLTTIAGDHNTADLIAWAARELRALPPDERASFSAASLELAAGALLYLGGSSGPPWSTRTLTRSPVSCRPSRGR